jgi:hypothetical protein
MDITMQTATEALREERSRLTLTTGQYDLDALIGGIRQGDFYLVYSNDPAILDLFLHQILVNCSLPVEQGGFNAKALYVNICNSPRGKTPLDLSTLATAAKCAGIDPRTAFQNIYAVAAFNEEQQIAATAEAVARVKEDPDVKLVAIHNLTRFIETARTPLKAHQIVKQIVGTWKGVTAERGAALVVTSSASRTGRGRPSQPVGGAYVRQAANVAVRLTRGTRDGVSSVKATLVKHPSKQTPQSIGLDVPKGGGALKGRITPSFRQPFQKMMEEVKERGGRQNTLISREHQKAFDLLLKDTGSAEDATMANAGIPCVLDALHRMANVYNNTGIEALRRKRQELERLLKEPLEKHGADALSA